MGIDTIQFAPVHGTEEAILLNTEFCPGAVYYATDSGKMYLETKIKVLVTLTLLFN